MPTSKTLFHLTQLKAAVDKAGELAEILVELAQDNPNSQRLQDALRDADAVTKALKEQLDSVEEVIRYRMNS